MSSGSVTALLSPTWSVVSSHVWTPLFCDDSQVAKAVSPRHSYLYLLTVAQSRCHINIMT
ncbi:hypothetical protein [Trichormus variabilis]|uniref:hypothetical protein n=1 Tax=Anabaena variabilis TaxID=264691 RepID=UPI0019BACC16|nr:hypothetical protein [Trichormus variabilis]MBD2628305.1 hypothetical protein [Trichormus variabilis FACHB-164]